MKVCFFIFWFSSSTSIRRTRRPWSKSTYIYLYFLFVYKLSYQQSSADLEMQLMQFDHRDGVLSNYRNAFIGIIKLSSEHHILLSSWLGLPLAMMGVLLDKITEIRFKS